MVAGAQQWMQPTGQIQESVSCGLKQQQRCKSLAKRSKKVTLGITTVSRRVLTDGESLEKEKWE